MATPQEYWNTVDPRLTATPGQLQPFQYIRRPFDYAQAQGAALQQPSINETNIESLLRGLGGYGLETLGYVGGAVPRTLDEMFKWLGAPSGGVESGVDAISSAAPVVAGRASAAPAPPQSTEISLGQLGAAVPEAPNFVVPDFSSMFSALGAGAPPAPGASTLTSILNVPLRTAPEAPDTSAREGAIRALEDAPPPPPRERGLGERLMMALGTLAAGAASGDGSLRSTLVNAGPQLTKLAVREIEQAAEDDNKYKQAKLQHDLMIAQAKEDLNNIGRDYRNAVTATSDDNAERRYKAQLLADEKLAEAREKARLYSLDRARLQAQVEMAKVEAMNRQLDANFRRQAEIVKQTMPKWELKDGNVVIQRLDKDGNAFIDVKPVGRSGATLKQMLELGGNEELPPAFRQRMNTQGAFIAAAQMGDPEALVSVVATDLARQPELMQGMEEELQAANELASMQGILPGTPEHQDFVQSYIIQAITKSLSDPAELDKAAKLSPYAQQLKEMMRADFVSR